MQHLESIDRVLLGIKLYYLTYIFEKIKKGLTQKMNKFQLPIDVKN